MGQRRVDVLKDGDSPYRKWNAALQRHAKKNGAMLI